MQTVSISCLQHRWVLAEVQWERKIEVLAPAVALAVLAQALQYSSYTAMCFAAHCPEHEAAQLPDLMLCCAWP